MNFKRRDVYYANARDSKKFYALKFMTGEYVIDNYTCVYDKNIKVKIKENPITNNYTINISVPNNIKIEDICESIVEQLKNQIKERE